MLTFWSTHRNQFSQMAPLCLVRLDLANCTIYKLEAKNKLEALCTESVCAQLWQDAETWIWIWMQPVVLLGASSDCYLDLLLILYLSNSTKISTIFALLHSAHTTQSCTTYQSGHITRGLHEAENYCNHPHQQLSFSPRSSATTPPPHHTPNF